MTDHSPGLRAAPAADHAAGGPGRLPAGSRRGVAAGAPAPELRGDLRRRPGSRSRRAIAVVALLFCAPALGADGGWIAAWPWWGVPLAIFVTSLLLGMIAVPAGVGGGVLFVPIVGSFFPLHIDFVRGAGLLVALASALSAGPSLLRCDLASLRLGLPLALVASTSSIFGAMLGLALPASAVQIALGVLILGIVVLMATARSADFPEVKAGDRLAAALGMQGTYLDPATGKAISWRVHRLPHGLLVFVLIGVLAGMFGIGAGWANVPTLNLLMGAPLKVAAGTSGLILSLVDSSAAWVYLNRGAVLPVVAVPAVAGMMLGAQVGVRLLQRLPSAVIRRLVVVMLLAAGARALLKGTGIWT